MSGARQIIREGSRVAIRYTLHDDSGRLLEQSGAEPSVYIHGHTPLVPGLKRALDGRGAGDQFEVAVPAAEGYGEPIEGVGPQPIPRGTFPEDTELVVGMEFPAETPDGEPITLFITDLTEHAVFVDKNHPFAGKTLHYSVEVVAIMPADAGGADS